MITIILLIISSIFNAIMDTLQHHYRQSIFYHWGRNNKLIYKYTSENSWENKWSGSKESFIGSSTIFVWLTDLWHFAKTIHLLTFISAIVLYNPITQITTNNQILDYILIIFLYKFIYGLVFHLFYKYLLINKHG